MLNANNASLSVFLTAATSSLGRETTRQLVARGHRVTGLTKGFDGAVMVRKDGGLPAYSDPYRAGEIKSIIKMAAADVVIHVLPQEANVFPHKGLDWADSQRLVDDSTAALVDAASSAGTKFVVFLSSVAVYGDTHGEWVDESAEAGDGEMAVMVTNAENKILHGAFSAAVLRAGTLYGAYDSGMKFLSDAVMNGRAVYLGDNHTYRNWVHESDLAKAAVLAAEQQPTGQIFNVTDDSPSHAADFITYLATSMGLTTPAPLNPPAFALDRMTSAQQRDSMNTSLRVKTGKAKEQLGWSPRYANFRSGIDQTLMMLRAEPVNP
ncbi:MAG: NAD-dependent epimerase/dehydratase family protein [Chloroflexota bacterium]